MTSFPLLFKLHPMDDLLKFIPKTVDNVWKEIVTVATSHDVVSTNSVNANASEAPAMTLEDFLTKVGAVKEEDIRGVLPHKIRPRKPHPQDQAPIVAENTALQVNLKLVG